MTGLDGLLEFIAVVERGTFTGAARQLGVSVSHISRQIAELEARLAVQLLTRSTRQMVLTEAGRRLFEASQPLLEELLRAQENLQEANDAVSGDIRISLAGKFAEEQLVPLLTSFCVLHPDVRLDVDMSARNIDILAEGFHLAVRLGPLESSSSLVATRLTSVPLQVLASRALLNTLQPIRTPADLPPALCLRLVNRPWEFVKEGQRISVAPAGKLESNSGAVLIRAALDGLGIVNVPAYYASSQSGAAGLQRLLRDWASVEQSTFYIVFPAARHMPTRVRRLIDYLQSQSY